MDRVIKFRAWDKVNKWMDDDLFINSNGIIYTDDVVAHDTPNKEIEKAKTNNFVVMQFTGLTDRNGVEIYEGDILKSIYDETCISVVEYCTENVGSCGCCYDEFEGAGFKAKDLKFKEAVVIGNIYEHPHLLEGVK